MTKKLSLAEKLRSGQPVITAWSLLPAPIVPELLARAGYPAVTLDLQHGMHDFNEARDMLAAIALGGAHRIVRVPLDDNASAARLADVGAECVIAPMINSAKEASAFARALKYPPVGDRSYGPFRASVLSGLSNEDYLERANTEILSLAMVESREALDALDDILAVPELDGIFVGPSDLSISMSNGEAVDPNGEETARTCAMIAEKATEAGKIPGIFCLGAEKVKETVDQGYKLITHGIDAALLDSAAKAALGEVEAFVGTVEGDRAAY
ncbi:MAG: hydroxyacid aldolase [Roseibium sp.]|nr:hydroxyacid aldolase [Roseibium sp.]